MKMTLEAIKEYAGVEVSLLNTGIILTDLSVGEVTGKDLHECLPHPMNLIRVTLKGKDVKRLVYEIEKNSPRKIWKSLSKGWMKKFNMKKVDKN